MAGGNGDTPINLEIDEETAKGLYTNFAVVSHSNTEFVMDFAFVFPQQPKNKIKARVITSPSHAKRFALALQDNIRKYEEKFGEIKG